MVSLALDTCQNGIDIIGITHNPMAADSAVIITAGKLLMYHLPHGASNLIRWSQWYNERNWFETTDFMISVILGLIYSNTWHL